MVIAPGFYTRGGTGDAQYIQAAVDVLTTFRHETSPRPKEQAEKTMRRIVRELFGLSDGGSKL
jgi:hypothetical protein